MKSGIVDVCAGICAIICCGLFVSCGGADDDICGTEQYTNGICDPGCKNPDPDCGGGGGSDANSSDPCVRSDAYRNGTCDACPYFDYPCDGLRPDPCLAPNRYGDGTCDACTMYDPDCSPTSDTDPCMASSAYADGTCDACPIFDPDCLSLSEDPCDGIPYLYGDGTCDACTYYDEDCGLGADRLAAITGVTATDGTEAAGVSIEWDRLPPATQYFLRRSPHPVDGFDRVPGKEQAQSKQARLSMLDDTVSAGQGFYYQVEAMHPSAFQSHFSNMDFGFVAAVGVGDSAPSMPTGVDALADSPNAPNGVLHVFWDFDPAASSYEISRRIAGDGAFVAVDSSDVVPGWSGPQFLDDDIEPGFFYEYQIVAINAHGASPAATSAPVGLMGIDGPSDLDGSQTGPVEITLTWTAFPDATGYEVFAEVMQSGEFSTSVAVTMTAGAVIGSITAGTPGSTEYFRYRVRATGPFGRTEPSNIAQVGFYTPFAVPTAPTNLLVGSVDTNQINLSWDSVVGATSYSVESHDGDGVFAAKQTTQNGFASISSLAMGTTYTFRVRASNPDNAFGPYSDTVAAATRVGSPTGLTVVGGVSGITVSWNDVLSAVSYNVYRNTSCSGSFSLLQNVSGASTLLDAAAPHVYYYYRVAAVDAGGIEGEQAGGCPRDYVRLPAPTGAALTLDNPPDGTIGLRITYDEVSGADSYGIGQAESADGPFVTRIYPSGTSMRLTEDSTDSPLAPLTPYYVQVSARLNTLLGEPATMVSQTTSIGIPQDVVVTEDLYDAAQVTWSAVPGATYYEIYRTDENPPGDYSLVATGVTDLSYVDSTVPLSEFWSGGTMYVSYYKVQAFASAKVGSGSNFGVYGRARRVFSVAAVGASDEEAQVAYGPGCPTGPDQDACLPGYECVSTSCLYPSPPTDGVDVHWTEVEGAASYKIYRQIDVQGAFEPMGEVVPGVHITCNATRGTCGWKDSAAAAACAIAAGCEQMLYGYRVNALGPHGHEGPDGGANGGYVSGTPVLGSPTAAAGVSGSDIAVSWNSIAGAGAYRVMRGVNGQAFAEVAIVSATSYLDTGVVSGSQYRYFVRSLSIEANQETNVIGNVTAPQTAP